MHHLKQFIYHPMTKPFTSVLILSALITGCSYGSMYEAREACREWKEADKKVRIRRKYREWIYSGHKRNKRTGVIEVPTMYSNPSDYEGVYGERPGKMIDKYEVIATRSCYHEEETKQFLGRTKEIIEKKEFYDSSERPKTKTKITNRFKY